MALPWLLLSFLLFMVMPVPGSCERIITHTGSLIQCYDDQAPALTDATNGTEFRARLHRLLRTLPSAAAPTGFASLNSTGRDRAFVRGLCFDDATAPVPYSECLGCLTVAARNLTSGCRTTTRRAGIWTDGCFVGFADSDASSPSEDAFRSRVLLRGGHVAVPVTDAGAIHYSDYLRTVHARVVAAAQLVAMNAALINISGPRMLAIGDETSDQGWPVTVRITVHVLGQCARDRTELECSLCLFDSAEAVDWDLDATRGDDDVAAAVVGYNCYLRFHVSSSLLPQNLNEIVAIAWGSVGVLIIAVYLVVILRTWG